MAVRRNGLANTTIGGGGREGGRPEDQELFLRAVLLRRVDKRHRGRAGGRERPSILPGGTMERPSSERRRRQRHTSWRNPSSVPSAFAYPRHVRCPRCKQIDPRRGHGRAPERASRRGTLFECYGPTHINGRAVGNSPLLLTRESWEVRFCPAWTSLHSRFLHHR